MKFFSSHAGRGVIGVTSAALCLAWPPAASWVLAAVFLGWGCSHLKAAFRRLDLAYLDRSTPEPSQQIASGDRADLVLPRSSVEQPHTGLSIAADGRGTQQSLVRVSDR